MNDAERLYPWILDPLLTQQLWGGDALVTVYGKSGDPNAKYGESWECWDANRIRNGPLAGSTVAEMRGAMGTALLGNLDPARIFPILTKIIDARDWLSVQVHPDDAYAQRVEHQPNGKTECWYILQAEPGAELVLGWTRDTDRAEYERRVANGTLGDILRHVPVRAGDAYYLPSGTLHAIGAGIVLFETQQASDLTYRIFDWNRVGADGKPRELNIAKAADVLDYQHGTGSAIPPVSYSFDGLARTALIGCPNFVVERAIATQEPASIPTDARPLIVLALDEPVNLVCENGTAALQPYQTALIPAAAQWVRLNASASTQAPCMLVAPPQSPEQLPVRLLAAGVPQDQIDAFMSHFNA